MARTPTSSPPSTAEQRTAAARIGALARRLPPTDPRVLDARRDHAAAVVAAVVEAVVAGAPPLRAAQLDRLRAIFEAAAAGATPAVTEAEVRATALPPMLGHRPPAVTEAEVPS